MAATRDFLVGVVVGSAIGAAAALLYAPQSGAETRETIKLKTGEVADRTGELAQQAKGRITEAATQVKDRAGELAQQTGAKAGAVVDQVREKASDLTQQAQEAVDRGKQMVDRHREAVTSAVDAGREAFTAKQSELQQAVAADSMPGEPASPPA